MSAVIDVSALQVVLAQGLGNELIDRASSSRTASVAFTDTRSKSSRHLDDRPLRKTKSIEFLGRTGASVRPEAYRGD
jgi:hypothetical protein